MGASDAEIPTLQAGEEPAPAPGPPRALVTGTRLGRYLILEPLASGGVGDVYVAYDPQLDRRVALKVLRSELIRDGGQVEWRGRLLREAHALAKLSHPNVVAIHDAGLWEGELFLAMELLEGQTLRELLEGPTRGWSEVLPLLIAAGRGLAAAHAAGLVHRDFKPSNVLITRAGRVCVVDFGLARPAHEPWRPPEGPASPRPPAAVDPLAVTRIGHIPGTPGYMSPEQCRGEPVDARSDQFSFCVTLYEALCGRRPFEAASFEAYAEGFDRAVSPAPMDGRVPAQVARAVLRGLSLNPSERHPTMDALLEALERDPGARRRRRALRAAGVALVLAIGAGVPLLRQAPPCTGAEARWEQAWGAGAEGVRRAFLATGRPYAGAAWERVSRSMDAYGKGWAAMHTEACEATRVRGDQSRELMDLRMDCLQQRLLAASALAAVLGRADEEVVTNAASAAAALPSLEACADARALLEGERRPEAPAAREALERARAEIAEARALHEAGKFSQGLAPARAAVEHAAASGSPVLRFEALEALTRLQLRSADYAGSLEHAQASARAALESGDARLQTRAWLLLMLTVGLRLERFEEANLWASYAQASLARARTDELEAQYFHGLALLRNRETRYPEAAAAAEKALAAEERLSQRNEVDIGQVLTTLAWAEGYLGKRQEALQHLERAREALAAALGESHPSVLRTRSSHAMALVDLGRLEEAEVELRAAFRDAAAVLGPEHPSVAAVESNLGSVLAQQGKLEEARSLVMDAAGRVERKLGKEHRRLGAFYENVASVELEAGRPAEALSWARRALAVHGGGEEPSPRDMDLGRFLRVEGEALAALGRAAEAVPRLERAVRISLQSGALPEELGDAQRALAMALLSAGGGGDRPRALLMEAREQFLKAGARSARELKEVETWLDAHPAAPPAR